MEFDDYRITIQEEFTTNSLLIEVYGLTGNYIKNDCMPVKILSRKISKEFMYHTYMTEEDIIKYALKPVFELYPSFTDFYAGSGKYVYKGHGELITPKNFSNYHSPYTTKPQWPGNLSDPAVEKLPGMDEKVLMPKEIRGLSENDDDWTTTLRHAIILLNDTYKWTREQIANWIETLDIDTTFKVVTNEQDR